MKERRSPFLAYRYLVTPISPQITFNQLLNKDKETLISEIIENLASSSKTEWNIKSKRYLLYGSQSRNDIHVIKFARETNEKLYLEGEEDIEIQGIKEAKYVYLIIDTVNQIILLERNVSIFSSIDNAVKVLSSFFREKMKEFDYVVNIYPLATKRKFWNYVETADEIFELTLIMNAPNMAFFGHEDTRDVLKQIKEATNNEEFDLSFKNKEGNLKIAKETIGKWVDYVREVGGKYILKFSYNGQKEVKTSKNDTVKTYIERKKTEKYSDYEMDNIKSKLDAINKLENRDDK
ncbi:hypothetical protein [Leeuwenhoekiella sp. H156]|uniref:hypothetical protein n=1 Tax=Leeuwenhoekiella sp. H156 TaxID=3450128 RepID=UPI003FA4BB37